jgi:hypothetical protein
MNVNIRDENACPVLKHLWELRPFSHADEPVARNVHRDHASRNL